MRRIFRSSLLPWSSFAIASGADSILAAEFRRYCIDHQYVPPALGTGVAGFLSHLGRVHSDYSAATDTRHRSGGEGTSMEGKVTEAELRSMNCFRFEGERMMLVPSTTSLHHSGRPITVPDETSTTEPLKKDIWREVFAQASKLIPPVGLPPAGIKILIAEINPGFGPSVVGALSLKEALEKYPEYFLVEPVARGKWIVKQPQPKSVKFQSSPVHEPGGTLLRRSIELVHDEGASHLEAKRGPVSSYLQLQDQTSSSSLENALLASLQKYRLQYNLVQTEAIAITDLLAFETLQESSSSSALVVSALQGGIPPGALLSQLKSMALLNVTLRVRVRPLRTPRGAHLFIDADGLTKDDVSKITAGMKIIPYQSTRLVARQPAAPTHSALDIIADEHVPTHLVVEQHALKLKVSSSVVLKDIVYICTTAKRIFYVENVAQRVSFPDANVFVCTPTTSEKLFSRKSSQITSC